MTVLRMNSVGQINPVRRGDGPVDRCDERLEGAPGASHTNPVGTQIRSRDEVRASAGGCQEISPDGAELQGYLGLEVRQ